jgi:hypothetical protein
MVLQQVLRHQIKHGYSLELVGKAAALQPIFFA